MTKILLVEDDKSLREIYGVRLLAEGYDIISAGDGEEALAMAIKDRPALIVSDVMMPKISGFDMLDILRSTTETRDIKVIMMTALSSDDQRARGEQLGADRYLVKSQVGIEDVVRTVHEVLGDAPTTAGAASFSSAPTPRSAAPAVPERPGSSPEPTATPQPQPTGGLPRPTAPFSTDRPAGFGVGDRVINPLPKAESTGPDLGSQIDNELANSQPAPQPVEELQLPELPTPPAPPANTSAPEVHPIKTIASAQQPVAVVSESQVSTTGTEAEPQAVAPAPANPFVTPEQAPPAPVEANPVLAPVSTPEPQPQPQPAQLNELGFEETPRTVSPNGPSNPFAAS